MNVSIEEIGVSIGRRQILSRVNVTVAEGTVAGIVGPNASGKTTLLRSVYRALRPSTGAIRIGDRDVWQISARENAKSTGAVCQEQSLTYDLTVSDLVRLGRFPHKGLLDGDNQEDDQIIARSIERVGLADLAHRRLSELSGGERQRALIAKGLAQQPRLLILDEPTNHLDIRYQVEILELVRGLGITVIVTLHDLNLAAAYCDSIHIIAHGGVVASGTPQEVLISSTVERVFGVRVVCGQNPLTGRPHLYFGPLGPTSPGDPS